MDKIELKLPVPDGRTNICYRVGCNHFWLCWKHDPEWDGSDLGMAKCDGYIWNKDEISYCKWLAGGFW